MEKSKNESAAKVICSVCFRDIHAAKSNPDHPTRHGFKGYNIQRNQSTGHHSEPCMGVAFANYTVSCEGTKAALARANDTVTSLEASIVRHTARPVLHDMERGRKDGKVVYRIHDIQPGAPRVTVAPDCDAGFPYCSTVQAYDDLHTRIAQQLERSLATEISHRDFLARKIAAWTAPAAKAA